MQLLNCVTLVLTTSRRFAELSAHAPIDTAVSLAPNVYNARLYILALLPGLFG